jgi:mono/diheme cytochrome c family protein
MPALLASVVAFLPMVLMTAAANAQSREPDTGGAVYRTYCASCHGVTARGDGPVASEMNRKPSNLTEMAKRNGGQFPSELAFRAIDGRQPVRGHGGPDMPVWGDVFIRSRDAGDAERAKAMIQSLVEFLDSIQLRRGHEQ